MRKEILALSCAALALANCASSPENVEAQYVSPMTYDSYECDEISNEMDRIAARVTVVAGEQEDAAARDAAVTGVGVILFWPALFFLASGDHADELGRLKGEQEALETAAIQKKCEFAPEVIAAREERQKEAERLAAEKRKQAATEYQ